MNSIILLSLFISVCIIIIVYFTWDYFDKLDKQKSSIKSKMSPMGESNKYIITLQEITLRLFTSHCFSNTTKFDKFDLAFRLTVEFCDLDTNGEEFDVAIKNFLDNKFAGELKYQSAPLFLDYRECRLYPIIYNNVIQSLYFPLRWPLPNVTELSMILTTAVSAYYGDEFKDLIFEKYYRFLESRIDIFMGSSLTFQIITDYAKKYDLPLTN